MSFKDLMIRAIEDGRVSEDRAYGYVRDQLADKADQMRQERKLGDHLPVFLVGDRVIWNDDDDLGDLRGTVTRAGVGLSFCMVKLDTGGTFRAERKHLRMEAAD